MIRTIQCLVIALSLLAGTSYGGGHRARRGCPHVPSTTAEQACSAVCGTGHMRRLCLHTLLRRHKHRAEPPVTHYAGVAARSALDSYDATAAAARQAMLHGSGAGAVPSSERVAYACCVEGYEAARRSMSRVADDLAARASSSCGGAANLTQDCTGGLRGMDACRRNLLGYPASPLYGRNIADRNKTLLVALLCSLVPRPPEYDAAAPYMLRSIDDMYACINGFAPS